MNPFHLRIEKFDYSLPAGRVIAAVQLQEMAQSRDILSAARVQAAEIVQAAQDECRVLLAQARQQADMLMVKARSQIEAEVVAQHVGWLVAAEQLEASLITQARQQILAAIASVVTAWAGQQSVEQILIHRLGAQVEKMAHDEMLVLQVHPQHLPAVVSALGERVQCVGDESMPEDTARLGSPMLQVSLSLRSHLAQLILWLQEPAHD
ncbi:type III secretion system stator protein SctL [Yersinia sp. 2545 StPb PI]|uniref:type III secretion system stator protein SctL n=1 Tax=Yersinia sp. 2545 StPb PI TaxID=3117410 RepID=UPI003FA45C63